MVKLGPKPGKINDMIQPLVALAGRNRAREAKTSGNSKNFTDRQVSVKGAELGKVANREGKILLKVTNRVPCKRDLTGRWLNPTRERFQ